MKQVALPFRVAPSDSWELGRWRRLDGEDGEEYLGDRIEDWDYLVPLSLVSEVIVDVTKVRAETGMPDDDDLVVAAIWEASSTGIREVACIQELPAHGRQAVELVLHLEGDRLGGRLALERQIILRSAGSSTDPLAPRACGSIVLAETRDQRASILLEGDAARFPTEVADFSELPIAEPNALWYLDLDLSDLEQSPLSAMRLFVNGNHKAMESALLPASQNTAGLLIRSILQWDVARTLIHRALDEDEMIEDWDAFPEDSVGLTLQQMILRYWPGETAASLRARRSTNPSRFEYQLQARFRLMDEL